LLNFFWPERAFFFFQTVANFYFVVKLSRSWNGMDFAVFKSARKQSIFPYIKYVLEYGIYTIPAGTYEGLTTDAPTDLGNLVLDYNQYNFSSTSSKYRHIIHSSRSNTSTQDYTLAKMKQMGYELHSSTSDNLNPPTTSPTNSQTITNTPSSTIAPTPTPIPGDSDNNKKVDETDYGV